MSHDNSPREQVEASSGDLERLPVGISEGCLDSLLSVTVDALRCISTTPVPNPPSQREQGSQDSPPRDPLPVLRGVTINLSEIILDSEVVDPSSVAASMFKPSDPTPIEELVGGACELPCTSRGEDPKKIKKNKDTSFSGLKYNYRLNSFQLIRSDQEDKDEDASPAEKLTQDDLISTSFKNEQMVAKMKAFDLLEGVMVSVWWTLMEVPLLICGTSIRAIMFSSYISRSPRNRLYFGARIA